MMQLILIVMENMEDGAINLDSDGECGAESNSLTYMTNNSKSKGPKNEKRQNGKEHL